MFLHPHAAFLICALLFVLFLPLVATFTFYLADSDDRELTAPTGSEDNVISFAYLDPSEPPFSGTEPEDERRGALTVSGVTSDGFDVSWRLKAHGRVYDHFAVQYKETGRSWPARELRLPGNATGCRIEGLKAATQYQIKLYGKTNRQRSALLDAVAVTGISFSIRLIIDYYHHPVEHAVTEPPSTNHTYSSGKHEEATLKWTASLFNSNFIYKALYKTTKVPHRSIKRTSFLLAENDN